MKKLFPIISNLQAHHHSKPDFQNVYQHTGDRWLIHGIKHCKDIQLECLELPGRISLYKI